MSIKSIRLSHQIPREIKSSTPSLFPPSSRSALCPGKSTTANYANAAKQPGKRPICGNPYFSRKRLERPPLVAELRPPIWRRVIAKSVRGRSSSAAAILGGLNPKNRISRSPGSCCSKWTTKPRSSSRMSKPRDLRYVGCIPLINYATSGCASRNLPRGVGQSEC